MSNAIHYTVWDIDALGPDVAITFVNASEYDDLAMRYELAKAKAAGLEKRLNAVQEALGLRFPRSSTPSGETKP